MGFSSGRNSISLEDLLQYTTEGSIASFYFGITEIPCVINSPLRKDTRPSFGIYSSDGKRVYFVDFATNERGGLFDLLSLYWGLPFQKVIERVYNDLQELQRKDKPYGKPSRESLLSDSNIFKLKSPTKIEVKIREWRQYDIKYWESYGVSKEWLEYANVYPISHKIITKNDRKYTFGTDKYAYAFVEKKEGNTSIKVYQPFNKNGFKWCTSTDRSVISLWTKVPSEGERICVCASLKDALCLWANTGIPSVAIQGEGYIMSDTAVNELKRRFKNVYVLFDNDPPGLIDGEKLSKLTGFTNIVLPHFEGGKDISDLFHILQDKEKFRETIIPLFINKS